MATPGRPQGFTSVQRTSAIKDEGDLDPLSFFASSIPVEPTITTKVSNSSSSSSSTSLFLNNESSSNQNHKEEFEEIDLEKYQKKLNATKEYINEASSVAYDVLSEGLSTAMAFAGFNTSTHPFTHSLTCSLSHLLTYLLTH